MSQVANPSSEHVILPVAGLILSSLLSVTDRLSVPFDNDICILSVVSLSTTPLTQLFFFLRLISLSVVSAQEKCVPDLNFVVLKELGE